MQLKYKELIEQQKLSTRCPFEDCESKNLKAFRWIAEPIDAEDNFLPKIILEQKNKRPMRKNSADDYAICSSCGLSMFISEEKAKSYFKSFPRNTQLKLGYTHIAKGDILAADGLMSKVSKHGHFDFFEFNDVDLQNKFEILGTIA